MKPVREDARPPGRLSVRRILTALGPGLISGAADDDPSGIATYSIAGASLGLSMLWTALLTWPLMAAVQMTCARIGMVTGRGLAYSLQRRFPRRLVLVAAVALLLANTINIAADLSGMADAVEMLTGVSSHLSVVVFGVGISWATVRLRYAQIARTLKWLALFLFAYVATAFVVRPDWLTVLGALVVPRLPKARAEWETLVAIFGTTISPYLFFWQASQEVEEEKIEGKATVAMRRGVPLHVRADRGRPPRDPDPLRLGRVRVRRDVRVAAGARRENPPGAVVLRRRPPLHGRGGRPRLRARQPGSRPLLDGRRQRPPRAVPPRGDSRRGHGSQADGRAAELTARSRRGPRDDFGDGRGGGPDVRGLTRSVRSPRGFAGPTRSPDRGPC